MLTGGDFGVRINMARIAQDVQSLRSAATTAQQTAQGVAPMLQTSAAPAQVQGPAQTRDASVRVQPVSPVQVLVQLMRGTEAPAAREARDLAPRVMRDLRASNDNRSTEAGDVPVSSRGRRDGVSEAIPGRAPALAAAVGDRSARGIERAANGNGAIFAPQVNVTVQAPPGGSGAQGGGGRGPEQEKMFGELIARMVRDGIRAEMSEFLAMQQRSGGMLKPVANL